MSEIRESQKKCTICKLNEPISYAFSFEGREYFCNTVCLSCLRKRPEPIGEA